MAHAQVFPGFEVCFPCRLAHGSMVMQRRVHAEGRWVPVIFGLPLPDAAKDAAGVIVIRLWTSGSGNSRPPDLHGALNGFVREGADEDRDGLLDRLWVDAHVLRSRWKSPW